VALQLTAVVTAISALPVELTTTGAHQTNPGQMVIQFTATHAPLSARRVAGMILTVSELHSPKKEEKHVSDKVA
jgi:hypothetical protein